MTDDQWKRVQELFEDAVARPVEERAPFLADACGDDAGTLAEVESLLAHDQDAPADFMRTPEPQASACANPQGLTLDAPRKGEQPSALPDPLIGSRIGGYHIKSVIAVGGMGTVYEAVQDEPRRVIALKVMHRNVASRSALRRFQFESQILARLRHPNIAQVFNAGMGDVGRERVPYFAMEYVPGGRIVTRYAVEKKLSTKDRLELFAKVCDAVHHGHQKGIIHRDLKPANILVDSSGQPKVIDFGVARATDSDLAITTQQTNIGQLIGTMQYMSPEQCDADPHDLDTRSDVYSLGVVLYELLTGELPYEASGSTIYQATQIIKERMPRALSSINPKLRGDVETIAVKALEKDRDRRYQSAADLGKDVRRHLNHEPIEARPPTRMMRAVRWITRHPVIATAGVCLGMFTITVAATFLSVVYLGYRPYEMRLSDDYREAQLLSVTGKVLKSWHAGEGGDLMFAELVERPDEFGGGRLALLGFSNSQVNPFPGSLCAFDTDHGLETPTWQRRIETGDILPQLREERHFSGRQFGVRHARVFDVFPEDPGQEILVVFVAGVYSQRVIRVYDLSGDLLYEVWHDGNVGAPYWMADANLVVFAGQNAMEHWDRQGNLLKAKPNPRVVFALRPRIGAIRRDDYLRSVPGDDPADPLNPVWYLRLLPDDARVVTWGVRLLPPQSGHDPGRSVGVAIRLKGQDGPTDVFWTLDDRGREVPGTRDWNDSYKQNLLRYPEGDPDRLPDPESFKLVPFGPIAAGPA